MSRNPNSDQLSGRNAFVAIPASFLSAAMNQHLSGSDSGAAAGIPAIISGPIMDDMPNPAAAILGLAPGSSESSSRKTESSSTEAQKNRKEQDEAKLTQIYEKFHFDPLWDRLSQVLTRLKGDPSAAQILLPLIEVS